VKGFSASVFAGQTVRAGSWCIIKEGGMRHLQGWAGESFIFFKLLFLMKLGFFWGFGRHAGTSVAVCISGDSEIKT
jgi:hypothetical protein